MNSFAVFLKKKKENKRKKIDHRSADLFLGSLQGFPTGSDNKESACKAGDSGSNPESGRSPGEDNPAFLPWKPPGERSLAAYSPWGGKRFEHNLSD